MINGALKNIRKAGMNIVSLFLTKFYLKFIKLKGPQTSIVKKLNSLGS
jgi:hypothetical protein